MTFSASTSSFIRKFSSVQTSFKVITCSNHLSTTFHIIYLIFNNAIYMNAKYYKLISISLLLHKEITITRQHLVHKTFFCLFPFFLPRKKNFPMQKKEKMSVHIIFMHIQHTYIPHQPFINF